MSDENNEDVEEKYKLIISKTNLLYLFLEYEEHELKGIIFGVI